MVCLALTLQMLRSVQMHDGVTIKMSKDVKDEVILQVTPAFCTFDDDVSFFDILIV